MLDLTAIRAARERVAGRVHTTPTLSTRLGERVGVRLVLKCENLQKTGSFKPRGALNKLSQLDDTARARGVVTVSAGNHAAAMAWAARRGVTRRRHARRGIPHESCGQSRLRR
jgi:threonine dehydratase